MNCKNCGNEFEPKSKIQVHCSRECKDQWKYNNLKIARQSGKVQSVTYTCKHCGKEYHPKEKNRNTYCSRECFFEYLQENKAGRKKHIPIGLIKKLCVVCGKEYEAHQKNMECCSEECRKQSASIRSSERSKQKKLLTIIPRDCKECGTVFTPEYRNKKRNFCSDTCSRRYCRREAKRTRRAMKRNAFVSPVNKNYIFKRDKGICKLCGKHVDVKSIAPHPMSITLDHIVPLSKGGTHEPKNIQLAHFICNSLKGNGFAKSGEQLMLFG